MTLRISLATRGRPALLIETLQRTIPNIVRPDTMLHVMVDADDPATIDALGRVQAPHLTIDVRAREDTVGEKFNRILEKAADVYLAMVDHTPHVTLGFDQRIVDAAGLLPDGLGFVFNHLANASFAGSYALPAKMAERLGYIFPTYFPYWFIDHWIDDIARLIGRISFADVVTDSSKKQPTQEMREPKWWGTWFDAAYLMRRKLAHDIIWSTEFQEPTWRKEMLSAQHPLIEFRSKWVNDSVRQIRIAMPPSIADERYQRVKARAIAMIPQLLDGMDEAQASAFRYALSPPKSMPAPKRHYA